MQVQLLKRERDLSEYADCYLKLTGYPIPYLYLKNNLVYGFYKSERLVAGFIIGIKPPFRTIELFAPPDSRERLMEFINHGKTVCEVCCFWAFQKERNFIDNAFIWFSMSQKVRVKGKKFFLGGTYAKGLANLYAYPHFASLISYGRINNKEAWICIAWRKYALISAIEVLLYKFGRIIHKAVKLKMKNYISFNKIALEKISKELNTDTFLIQAYQAKSKTANEEVGI